MTGPLLGGVKSHIIGEVKFLKKFEWPIKALNIFSKILLPPIMWTLWPSPGGGRSFLGRGLRSKCDLCDINESCWAWHALVTKCTIFHLSAPLFYLWVRQPLGTFRLALFSLFFSQKWPKKYSKSRNFSLIFGLRGAFKSPSIWNLHRCIVHHYMGNTWMHHCVQKIPTIPKFTVFLIIVVKKIRKISAGWKSERCLTLILLLVLLCTHIILYCAFSVCASVT